jgi:AraC-like DNA-binding protein
LAARGDGVGWAQLAADLGYADQAHLARDVTATVGTPPAAYARATRG